MPDPAKLRLAFDGAEHFPGAAAALLGEVSAALAGLPELPGLRLSGIAALSHLLRPDGPIAGIAARRMRGVPRPVRALLFDKSPTTNWALGWHQDRTIAVAARLDRPASDLGP